MDLNLYNMASCVRLMVDTFDGAKRRSVSRLPQLAQSLKNNGINTIFIRSNENIGSLKTIVDLLSKNFSLIVESSLNTYQTLKDELSKENVYIMPIFFLEDTAQKLKKFVEKYAVRTDAPYVYVKAKDKKITKDEAYAGLQRIMSAVKGKIIKFYWDCGLPLCNLKEEDFGYFIQKDSILRSACPSLVHIFMDGSMSICSKLQDKKHRIYMDSAGSMVNAFNQFNKKLSPYNSLGIYNQCSTCSLFPRICSGGCKDVIMKSFKGGGRGRSIACLI